MRGIQAFQVRRLAVAALLLGVGSCGGNSGSEELPPNVVLISLDTLRHDHLGFAGYGRDTSPFLDRLAARSIVFERAYTTMSWTLIAHMSLLSGLYPSQHDVLGPGDAIAAGFPLLAERLAAEGWDTHGVYFGPCTWLDPVYGFERGFGTYVPHAGAEEASARVDEAMNSTRTDRPWFLFVHLFDIHSVDLGEGSTMYAPPEPYDRMFVDDAPERLDGVDMFQWWEQAAVGATPERREAITALYDGGIRYVDAVLERWFTAWEEQGLLDNTVVIITSDHGEGLLQREAYYGGHGTYFEEGLRVPLIVRLPGDARAGERNSALVSHVDVVPTILELCGIEADERLGGRSLLGAPRGVDDWVFASRREVSVAVGQDVKVVAENGGPVRLHDLAADPDERDPLLPGLYGARFWERAQPLHDAATGVQQALFRPQGRAVVGDLDEATRDRLRGLGYGGEIDGR